MTLFIASFAPTFGSMLPATFWLAWTVKHVLCQTVKFFVVVCRASSLTVVTKPGIWDIGPCQRETPELQNFGRCEPRHESSSVKTNQLSGYVLNEKHL